MPVLLQQLMSGFETIQMHTKTLIYALKLKWKQKTKKKQKTTKTKSWAINKYTETTKTFLKNVQSD